MTQISSGRCWNSVDMMITSSSTIVYSHSGYMTCGLLQQHWFLIEQRLTFMKQVFTPQLRSPTIGKKDSDSYSCGNLKCQRKCCDTCNPLFLSTNMSKPWQPSINLADSLTLNILLVAISYQIMLIQSSMLFSQVQSKRATHECCRPRKQAWMNAHVLERSVAFHSSLKEVENKWISEFV